MKCSTDKGYSFKKKLNVFLQNSNYGMTTWINKGYSIFKCM
jgi:hypothetical protein